MQLSQSALDITFVIVVAITAVTVAIGVVLLIRGGLSTWRTIVERRPPQRSSSTLGRTDIRTTLALRVVIFSAISVAILAVVSILAAQPTDRGETSTQVLTAVLPLLGTWVGTVMAYYFSRENYDSATRNTFQMTTGRNLDEVLRSTSVMDKMVSKYFSKQLTKKPFDEARKEILLNQLVADLDKEAKAQGKVWNRIPILTADRHPLYVIHRSLIDKFIAKKAKAGASQTDIEKLTLEDMYQDSGFQQILNESIDVVSEKATLSDVKAAMAKSNNCQDVFITRDGTKNEPVLGWITNNDIEEAGKV